MAGQQAAPISRTGAARAAGSGNDRPVATLDDIRAAQEAIAQAVRVRDVNGITRALDAASALGVTRREIAAECFKGRQLRRQDYTRRLEEADRRGTLR